MDKKLLGKRTNVARKGQTPEYPEIALEELPKRIDSTLVVLLEIRRCVLSGRMAE